MKFSGMVGNGPMNKRLDFGGDPDHCLDTEIVFRIHHYWEIRKVKVVNGHKSAAPSSHSFILIRQMAAVVIIFVPISNRFARWRD